MANNEISKKDVSKQASLIESLYKDACLIIDKSKQAAYSAVNEMLIKRNWLLGLRIQHEILQDQRAEYGKQVIKSLSEGLVKRYGRGFSMRNLYYFIDFYQDHQDYFLMKIENGTADADTYNLQSLTAISDAVPSMLVQMAMKEILQSLIAKSPIRLSWTHYNIIQQELTADGRAWYENEAANEMWSTRTLQRNVSSQYYHRLLQSQDKNIVRDEMKSLTAPLQDKLEYLKNPVVAEFLGFKNNTNYSESNLEQSIIDHLIPFLMELGKGFAFVDRQKHIHTEKEDYYIDLVFYNYHLRCFVLIDLKTTKLRYQDVGQMDMYVKMYDELVRPEGHNPTIGMLLCAETDEDVAHYSVLNGNDQLFAAKYLTFMPTQEELRREIEQQKEFYRLQNDK